ncbi:putative E3 SUMO-protein ligase RNF212 isoform X2 [Ascaphus truei]|uniref:putative E3 SUMO-protein ligase RNF212 isoform X2 n=1 Tax=Ascaphus truei TaxID=8439 RepID=UPI003F59ADE1
MAAQVRCNVCFREPGREAARFALTNCGHVLCELCLQKGKKEECPVCRSLCRTILLSKQTNPDVKALFMDINVLCKKYSGEFTQITEFQERHRRRSIAYYKGKIAKLEETIKKLTQQMQSCSMRPSQSYSRLPVSNTLRNPVSTHSENQAGYSSYSLPLSRQSTVKMVESMDVDLSSPQMKNCKTVAGPTRLSVISPPSGGRMGHVSYRSSSLNSMPGSLRSTPMGASQQSNVLSQVANSVSQTNRTSVWDSSSQRTSQMYQQTPHSSQLSGARQPISLSSILQRQNLK